MRGFQGEPGLALVGMPAWQGTGRCERHQPRLPWDSGTVRCTDISKPVCLKQTPYVSSPSTQTCFSSHVPILVDIPAIHPQLARLCTIWLQLQLSLCPILHPVPHLC